MQVLYKSIRERCDSLTALFPAIPNQRRQVLSVIADYIQKRKNAGLPVQLMYVCTHNSRRSQFGQVWGAVAAAYFNIPGVQTFSGGTEATAFHPNAIRALQESGFEVLSDNATENPVYTVRFGDNLACRCCSKVYDDAVNPKELFAAIMTCSDAEANCPFIPGVELRVGTTYDDPKVFDGTSLEREKYLERSDQIALEMLYVFSLVR